MSPTSLALPSMSFNAPSAQLRIHKPHPLHLFSSISMIFLVFFMPVSLFIHYAAFIGALSGEILDLGQAIALALLTRNK
jgi:hypothetical protein